MKTNFDLLKNGNVAKTVMKYKVGDKVRVKSLEWYSKNSKNSAVVQNGVSFTDAMLKYSGKTAVVVGIYHDSYDLDIDNKEWYWYDWMFEYDPLNEADSDGAELKEINHD